MAFLSCCLAASLRNCQSKIRLSFQGVSPAGRGLSGRLVHHPINRPQSPLHQAQGEVIHPNPARKIDPSMASQPRRMSPTKPNDLQFYKVSLSPPLFFHSPRILLGMAPSNFNCLEANGTLWAEQTTRVFTIPLLASSVRVRKRTVVTKRTPMQATYRFSEAR
jgi:hypothetical protein